MNRNTTLLLILLAMILFVMSLGSCSKNNYPNGCKPEKRPHPIKFKGFMSSVDSPRNVQATIFEISCKDKKRFEGKALSTTGDTIFIKFGFWNWNRVNLLKATPGMKITIRSYWEDKYKDWLPRDILINQ